MANVVDTLYSWSEVAGSNQPDGGDQATVQADLQHVQAAVRGWLALKGADITAAATTDLGAVKGSHHDIVGSTGISSFGSVSAGIHKTLKFEGSPTLTHSSSLILPGGADITAAPGDMLEAVSEGSGNWRVNWFVRGFGSRVAPHGAISGLVQSQAADTDHDTTISAGSATDGTGAYVINLASAITKQIDAAWAVGTNQGGLDGTESVAGTPDANTWYYIWLIARSDTGVVDALYSESASSPTMPTNYTHKRLIGAVLTNGSANIIAYKALELSGGGLFVEWVSPPADVAATITTSRRTDTISVPPSLAVMAHIRANATDGTSGGLWISSTDQTDAAPGTSVSPGRNIHWEGSARAAGQFTVRTTSGTIAARSTVANTDEYNVQTVGFDWARR